MSDPPNVRESASVPMEALRFCLWLLFVLSPFGGLYYLLKAHRLDTHRLRNKTLQGGVDMLHYVETSDGWRLALIRYPAKAGPKRHFPVLLLHGLSGNRLGFDLPGAPSLARTLSAAGFDVWVLETRGSNLSFHPDFAASPQLRQWTFAHHVDHDVPAAINFILGFTGTPRVHCVGHSLGGILSTAYLSLSAENAARVQSNVLIASSLIYQGSGSAFEKLVPLRTLSKVWPRVAELPIPHGLITQAADLLMGYSHEAANFFQYHTDNMDLQVFRQFHRFGFHTIPLSLILSLYSAAGTPEGICDQDGVAYLEHLRELVAAGGRAPNMLLLGGSADQQCPVSAVQRTADRLGALLPGQVATLIFGRRDGHQADYGHSEFLVGRRAAIEVFPVILRFLQENDRPLKLLEPPLTL